MLNLDEKILSYQFNLRYISFSLELFYFKLQSTDRIDKCI